MLAEMISAYDRAEDIQKMFAECSALQAMKKTKVFNYAEAESADFAARYGLPYGRLYLLTVGGKTAGCVALRQLADEKYKNNPDKDFYNAQNLKKKNKGLKSECELEMLYVKPEFRGLGYGSLLCGEVLADAEAIGYQRVFVRIMPNFGNIAGFYKKLGFAPTESDECCDFTEHDCENAVCLELSLNKAADSNLA